MVISSLVVTTVPAMLSGIRKEVSRLPGVEVFAQIRHAAKLILILESEDLEDSHKLASQDIQSIPGVLTVQLAYCHYEDLVEAGEGTEPGKIEHLKGSIVQSGCGAELLTKACAGGCYDEK